MHFNFQSGSHESKSNQQYQKSAVLIIALWFDKEQKMTNAKRIRNETLNCFWELSTLSMELELAWRSSFPIVNNTASAGIERNIDKFILKP